MSARPPRTDDFNHARQDVAVCWKYDTGLAWRTAVFGWLG
jgi:hypothetical protein